MEEFIEKLFEYIAEFCFWVCPKGCNGLVDWNDDHSVATCRICGTKSTDQITQHAPDLKPPPAKSNS